MTQNCDKIHAVVFCVAILDDSMMSIFVRRLLGFFTCIRMRPKLSLLAFKNKNDISSSHFVTVKHGDDSSMVCGHFPAALKHKFQKAS